MQDFKRAKEAVEDLARLAGKTEEYMPLMQKVLEAADAAEGSAVKLEHDGAPGVWIPANAWQGLVDAFVRAW